MYVRATTCCGLNEIAELWSQNGNTAKDKANNNLIMFNDTFKLRSKIPFLIFTDSVGVRNGIRFSDLIKENKLGKLLETEKKRNPNSNRLVKVWLWEPDYKAIAKYCKNCG